MIRAVAKSLPSLSHRVLLLVSIPMLLTVTASTAAAMSAPAGQALGSSRCDRIQAKVRTLQRSVSTAARAEKGKLRKELRKARRQAKSTCGRLPEAEPIGGSFGGIELSPGAGTGEFGVVPAGGEFGLVPGGGNPGSQAPCIPTANSALLPQAIASGFKTTLKGQELPGAVVAGGQASFWFRVGFNQAFDEQNFILRPNTTNTINHFVPQLGTPGNDFFGVPYGAEGSVGEYAGSVHVPACTPAGRYFLQWRAIKKSTGEWGGVEPSMVLEVVG